MPDQVLTVLPAPGDTLYAQNHYRGPDNSWVVRFAWMPPRDGLLPTQRQRMDPILIDVSQDPAEWWSGSEQLPTKYSLCRMVSISCDDVERHTALRLPPCFCVKVREQERGCYDDRGNFFVTNGDRHWTGIMRYVLVPFYMEQLQPALLPPPQAKARAKGRGGPKAKAKGGGPEATVGG